MMVKHRIMARAICSCRASTSVRTLEKVFIEVYHAMKCSTNVCKQIQDIFSCKCTHFQSFGEPFRTAHPDPEPLVHVQGWETRAADFLR